MYSAGACIGGALARVPFARAGSAVRSRACPAWHALNANVRARRDPRLRVSSSASARRGCGCGANQEQASRAEPPITPTAARCSVAHTGWADPQTGTSRRRCRSGKTSWCLSALSRSGERAGGIPSRPFSKRGSGTKCWPTASASASACRRRHPTRATRKLADAVGSVRPVQWTALPQSRPAVSALGPLPRPRSRQPPELQVLLYGGAPDSQHPTPAPTFRHLAQLQPRLHPTVACVSPRFPPRRPPILSLNPTPATT